LATEQWLVAIGIDYATNPSCSGHLAARRTHTQGQINSLSVADPRAGNLAMAAIRSVNGPCSLSLSLPAGTELLYWAILRPTYRTCKFTKSVVSCHRTSFQLSQPP